MNQVVWGPPKTTHSLRRVPLGQFARDAIAESRARYLSERRQPTYSDEGWVFAPSGPSWGFLQRYEPWNQARPRARMAEFKRAARGRGTSWSGPGTTTNVYLCYDLDMKTVSVAALRQNPTQALTEVEQGATYIVTRHNREIARLVPPAPTVTVTPEDFQALIRATPLPTDWTAELKESAADFDTEDPWPEPA